jgi:hypothetical protein
MDNNNTPKVITNKTRLLWGEPFKQLIRDVVSKLVLRDSIKTVTMGIENAELLNDNQIDIRKYVIENQHRFPGIYSRPTIILKENSNSFPDHYAIMIAITEIDNLDNYSSFDEMIETLRNNEQLELSNLGNEDHIYGDEDRMNCACGHTIQMDYSFLLRNKKNGMTLLMGMDCIDKNQIVSYEVLKKAKQKRDAIKRRIKQINKEENERILKFQKSLNIRRATRVFNYLKNQAKRHGRLDVLGLNKYPLMTFHKFINHKHPQVVDYRDGLLRNYWGFTEDKISSNMRECVRKYKMYKQNIADDK